MTAHCVLYPNPSGGLAILIPTGELSVEQVALKDVPADCPYVIASMEEVPSDRTFRGAWEADFSTPDGYGIGHDAWVAAQETGS